MTAETGLETTYRIETSAAPVDEVWDDFLAATPGGSHVQTSLWAQVKAELGWRPVRLKMHDHHQLIAGAQLLLKSLPMVGSIAYIPKGPILRQSDTAVAAQLLAAIRRVARANRIQYLVVQPADTDTQMGTMLTRYGFRTSALEVGPTATVRIDVTQNLETLLSQMKAKTRYNIRLGERRGITVREGTRQDLSLFYDALVATSQRQGFMPYPKSYFETMARVLISNGALQFLIASYRGEPVSILLAVCFGDTVIYKKGAWFGCHGEHHPNEVLHWAAIQWAKSHGYQTYDLEGIEPQAAQSLLHSEPLSEVMRDTVTHFKLGFGGNIAMLPPPYEYLYSPILRWAHQAIGSRIAHSSAFGKLREFLHKR